MRNPEDRLLCDYCEELYFVEDSHAEDQYTYCCEGCEKESHEDLKDEMQTINDMHK